MTREPAHSLSTDAASAKVDAALSVLIRLMAEQTARELAASAQTEEYPIHDAQAED